MSAPRRLLSILIVLAFGLMECIYLSVGGFWYGRLLDARYGLSGYIGFFDPAPEPAPLVWQDLAADAERYARQATALNKGGP